MLTHRRWLFPFTAVLAAGCIACGKAKPESKPKPAFNSIYLSKGIKNRLAFALGYQSRRVGLIAPDGTVLASVDWNTSMDAPYVVGNGTVTVISIDDDGRPTYVFDNKTGRKLLSLNLPNTLMSIGESAFAAATDSEVKVWSFSTGKEIYQLKTSALALRGAPDGGFVIHDNAQLTFVEESGDERWRVPVENLDEAGLAFERGSLYVLRSDRSFEERKLADGSLISQGTCEGEASNSESPYNCDGRPIETDEGHPVILHTRSAPGTHSGWEGDYDYYFWESKRDERVKLVARDRVGRERWRSDWAATSRLAREERVYRDEAGSSVGFVSGSDDRALLVYDDETGTLRFKRQLEKKDQMAGAAGSCWLIVTKRTVECLDGRTGAPLWTVETSGSAARAWPLPDQHALIADGNPLTLSRITADGHAAWQLELADSEFTEDSLVRHHKGGLVSWEFSDVLGVVDAPPGVAVIDLATGKRTQID